MIDRDHPAVEITSALEAETMRVERAECAVAGMPASDHPVVQRAARVLEAAHSRSATTSAHLSILTALEHLTADDLRQLPQVQELMAETWDAAWKRAWGPAACELEPNPYRADAA